MKKLSLFFLTTIVISSCNITKHVKANEYMLTENHIYIDSVKGKGADLQKYLLQKPNPRFLGMPIALYFHNIGDKNTPLTAATWGKKNTKSYTFIKKIFSEKQSIAFANWLIKLNKWFLNYQGPVILNEKKVKKTAENLSSFYKTQGFFNSKVDTVITKHNNNKKAIVNYYISKGKATILDSIKLKIESPILDSIYKNSNLTTLLKSGKPYKDALFRKEANNLTKLFRNNGIYHFTESALGFYVDSTRTDYKTNVDFIIAGNRLFEIDGNYVNKPYKKHTVNQINVVTDYSFAKNSETIKDTVKYNGINFLAYDKVKYNPKYLSQSIFFIPGDVYKDTLTNLTRGHLKSLKNFKSTSINFTTVPNTDDQLNLDIFLSPIEKYTLGLETEVTHSNIRNIGASAKFSVANKNTFRGAELLKLSFLGSYFNAVNGPGWEIGVDASLEVPRFMAPFGFSKLVPKRMSPRTLYSIGTSLQKNIGLDRRTFSILADYKWNYNEKKTIQVEAMNIQYIQNLNVNRYFDIYRSEFTTLNSIAQIYDTQNNTTNHPISSNLENQVTSSLSFIDDLAKNLNFRTTNPVEFSTSLNILDRYKIISSDFLIPTLAYSYSYNNQSDFKDNSFSFFKIRVANSGNILGLLSQKTNSDNKKTFLDIPLAQYFKTDIEFKRFWDLGFSSVFGFRTFIGAIIPYNNSDIPFIKSYFAGGSNDIRAWQTYELGPGSNNTGLEFNVGSFKFLTSAEYRFPVFNKLKGALFIDAGNIWDITNSDFVDDSAKLKGISALGEIAVGSGVGARVDFSFLIIRLDVGFKTYEPYLSGDKWFKNFNFGDAVYQIGINYPF